MFASYRPRPTVLRLAGLLLLVNALTANAQTPPPTPPCVANNTSCAVQPPEWTPRLYFIVPTMPPGGGSVPRSGYIPPPLPGENYVTVPMTWDLYQATVTYISGVNPQTIYGTFNAIRYQMTNGDSFVAHLKSGPCFILYWHQVPPPSQATVLQGFAHTGDTSTVGGPTGISGPMAACATNQNGQVSSGPGDVTIEVR